MRVLINDKIVSRDEASVNIEDRGYQFGDGVYEVVRVYESKIYELDAHVKRFFRSASEIDLTLPFTEEEIKKNIEHLVIENKLFDGGVYFQVTRGIAPRKHNYDRTVRPHLVAYPLYFNRPKTEQTSGVKVITVEDLRWLRCDIKSLNLLYNVMMKQKAQDEGAFEGIFIRDRIVTEGTSTNLFIVKDGVYKTHPVNNMILNGITRQRMLGLFKKNNYKFQEIEFTKKELFDADEVFITSTTSEVMPVCEIDNIKINDGIVGEKTKKAYDLFIEYINK